MRECGRARKGLTAKGVNLFNPHLHPFFTLEKTTSLQQIMILIFSSDRLSPRQRQKKPGPLERSRFNVTGVVYIFICVFCCVCCYVCVVCVEKKEKRLTKLSCYDCCVCVSSFAIRLSIRHAKMIIQFTDPLFNQKTAAEITP